jgi:uncharacterized protein
MLHNMNKKKIFRWIKMIIIVYGSIGIALFYLQEKLLFHPVVLGRDYQYKFDVPFKEAELAFNDTDTLNMVQFFAQGDTAKGVVLYFHGNKENINRYAKFAGNFTRQGYEVWMQDYPGFGKSTGNRSEAILYQQARQFYKLALSKYTANRIIIYGKSFGTGLAAYTAAAGNCKQLILETPYYSIPALFDCYAPIYPNQRMARYQLPVYQYVQETKQPVTIFHGTDDGVIPYRCAAKLKQVLKPGDQFITIDNGTHHNLNDFKQYHQVLDSLLQL